MYQTNKKPRANAERLTKIPRKRQNVKNPTSLMKNAGKYSMSEKTIPASVYDEKQYPRIRLIKNTYTVEASENKTTVRNFDFMNSFLLMPWIRFCLSVP